MILLLCGSVNAQVSGIKDLIRDPALSARCKGLLKDREAKLEVRQKLDALLRRNQILLKKTPQSSETLRTKIEISNQQVNNYLRLTRLRLRNMEENIVRKGCPGISL